MKGKLLDYIIGFQGVYYLVTGLWPLVHVQSFETVTGPKESHFLLHMTSLLIVVIAITLLLSLNREKSREILFLAIFSPIAFMTIEVVYRAQISWVYFLDFALEAILVALLIYAIALKRKATTENAQSKEK